MRCYLLIIPRGTEVPPKAHRTPTDLLQWSPNLQHSYSDALLCITKTRNKIYHIGKHVQELPNCADNLIFSQKLTHLFAYIFQYKLENMYFSI